METAKDAWAFLGHHRKLLQALGCLRVEIRRHPKEKKKCM